MRDALDSAERDRELVARFQSGQDTEAIFLELYDRYGPVVLGFLRRRIGNADLAAELNQEVFLAVLKGLDRFRGESSFKTWLFRMAQNRLSNLRRRWRTHLDELPEAAPEELIEELIRSGGETPDEEYGREERDATLGRCLAELPEVERAVVVGQYYENVTLDDLTRRFEMTNKSGARARLIAAQRKLRRCLERAGFTSAG